MVWCVTAEVAVNTVLIPSRFSQVTVISASNRLCESFVGVVGNGGIERANAQQGRRQELDSEGRLRIDGHVLRAVDPLADRAKRPL